MKKFRELIKKKNINLVVINIVILAILGLIFCIFNENNDIVNSFKSNCQVSSINDLKSCYASNRYVQINFTTAYQTEYVYEENNTAKAYYIDIDLEGYGLIAIVPKDVGDEILDGDKKFLNGYLEEFTGVNKEAYDKIVNDYVSSSLAEDPTLNEEDIRAVYLDVQLDSYTGGKTSNYFIVTILAIIAIINIYFIIKAIRGLSNPMGMKVFKNIDFNSIENDYDKGAFDYQSKNVVMTNNYIYSIGLAGVQVIPIKEIIWAYYHIQKQYGIQVNKSVIVLTNNRKKYILNDKNDEIFNVLFKLNNKILLGYTNDNQKLYNEITKK